MVFEEQKDSLMQNYEEVVSKMEQTQLSQGKKRTSMNDFLMQTTLGSGTYGKVVLVKHKGNGKLYAMKILKKKEIREKKQVEHTKTERRVLERVNHPFIVRMKYAFADKEKLYLVMDYCNGGELFFYLTNLRRFKEDAACFYSSSIVLALAKLHELNIVYRE
jgi:serine/threonine protein kinase